MGHTELLIPVARSAQRGSVATLSDSVGPARHRRSASPCPAMLRAQVTGPTIRARLMSLNFIDLGRSAEEVKPGPPSTK